MIRYQHLAKCHRSQALIYIPLPHVYTDLPMIRRAGGGSEKSPGGCLKTSTTSPAIFEHCFKWKCNRAIKLLLIAIAFGECVCYLLEESKLDSYILSLSTQLRQHSDLSLIYFHITFDINLCMICGLEKRVHWQTTQNCGLQ